MRFLAFGRGTHYPSTTMEEKLEVDFMVFDNITVFVSCQVFSLVKKLWQEGGIVVKLLSHKTIQCFSPRSPTMGVV